MLMIILIVVNDINETWKRELKKRNKEKTVKLLKTADCRCQDKSLFTNTENFLSELKKVEMMNSEKFVKMKSWNTSISFHL